MSKLTKIKIHRGLASEIVKDQKLLKAMSVFYSLKYLYVGGIIKGISKRYLEISKKLEISESNLRSKVKYLIEIGLIKRENNNLVFIGHNKIQKIFKCNTFKSFNLEYSKPKKLEIILKSLAIEENLRKQEHKIQNKILDKELKRFGTIEAKNIKKKIARKIRASVSSLTEEYKKREPSYSLNKITDRQNINPVPTLSRSGVARLFNRKSKSTGSRFLKKLKDNGLLIDDIKRIDLIYRKFNYSIYKSLELDSSYFIYKNNLYQRLPNIITLTNILA